MLIIPPHTNWLLPIRCTLYNIRSFVLFSSPPVRNNLRLMAQLSGYTENDVSSQLTFPCTCTLEPSSSGSHHISVCCSSQPLKCCHCHNAPLSHMMGKVYSFHHDFLMGKQTLRWSMLANSDICLVLWPLWLPWEPACALWLTGNPPPLVNWGGALDRGTFRQRTA